MSGVTPAPLVPAEVDLRGFEFMPLYGDRLFKSETWIGATPEGKVAALRLWWQAYGHEFPAASLPDNDTLLAEYAGYGVAVKAWLKLKPQVMRGWVKCSDGRLYHPFVADLVKEAWERRKAQRDRTEKARKARLLQNQSQNLLQTEKGHVTDSVTTPVTASTGQDRTGQDSTSKSNSASFKHPTGDGGEPRAAPPDGHVSTPDPKPGGDDSTMRGAMAKALRDEGVTITPSHPLLVQWVAQGVSVTQAREAVDIARERKPKPEKIPAAYLDPIIAQIVGKNGHAVASQVKRRPWFLQSWQAILDKAEELNLKQEPREHDQKFRERVLIAAGVTPEQFHTAKAEFS
jgi:hypothetical protein